MTPILNLIAFFRRAFASDGSTRLAWVVIVVLCAALMIEYADRLP